MRMNRLLALLLSLLLLAACLSPALAAEKEGEEVDRVTLHIGSVEELQKLARDCAIDSYSKNLTVFLDADLDLGGVDYAAIPIFAGIFEGQGHTIEGVMPTGQGSIQGFFRYLAPEAEVYDLKLVGLVEASVGMNKLGGVAGVNRGRIENCSFTGEVNGQKYIGGIAGVNEGSILRCSVSGSLSGKRFTGGVAGMSEGLIEECSSTMSVNTVVSEEILNLEDIGSVNLSSLELLSAEDDNVVSDTGGIVGYSKGVVRACENHGTVGYQHFGYNVGGIAGRQSGYLTECRNLGTVLGRKDVGGVVGQMEPYLDLIESIRLGDEIRLLNQYMDLASDDVRRMSDELGDVQDRIDAQDNGLADYYGLEGHIVHEGEVGEDMPQDLTGTITDENGNGGGGISSGGTISDREVEEAKDDLPFDLPEDVDGQINGDTATITAEDLRQTSDNLSQILGIVSSNGAYLAEDLTLVNAQASRVMMLMANALNGGAQMDIFEDVSDEMDEEDVLGRVSHNENLGSVSADTNVGGVVGAMGIEVELDMEDSVVEIVGANGIVNNTYDAKCVNSDNINRGEVEARRDRVGGVVGSSEMGVVVGGQGYGSVRSTDGSYAGGVVGYSSTIIRRSYAMCLVSAQSYVGGITGFGHEITGCASLIQADSSAACLGAIAGWADVDTEDLLLDNVYVHESLGAIDGISYAQKAVPVGYEELISREELPEEFRSLKLSFVADGKLVGTVTVPYGGDVSSASVPQVPQKEGYTGVWESFEMTGLRFNRTIQAIYTAHQSALASEETRDAGSPMSLILLEGSFPETASLRIEPYTAYAPEVENGRQLEAWRVRVSELDPSYPNYTLRYLAPELGGKESLAVYLYLNGKWREVQTSETGRYTSFPAGGEEVIFSAVAIREDSSLEYLLLGLPVVAALGIGLGVHAYTKKKRRAAASAEETTEDMK